MFQCEHKAQHKWRAIAAKSAETENQTTSVLPVDRTVDRSEMIHHVLSNTELRRYRMLFGLQATSAVLIPTSFLIGVLMQRHTVVFFIHVLSGIMYAVNVWGLVFVLRVRPKLSQFSPVFVFYFPIIIIITSSKNIIPLSMFWPLKVSLTREMSA
jgi:hypothetical protein